MTVNRWQIEVRLPECKVGKGIIANNGMVADSDPEKPKGTVGGIWLWVCSEKKPLWKIIRVRPTFEENFVRLEDIVIVSK